MRHASAGGQESISIMSLSEPFNELNTLLNGSDVRKTPSTAVPGWLKSFAKKQKIGGRSSVASSDAVPQSAAVRAPVDVSAVDDYLAGGRYGPASQADSRDRDRDIDRYRERQSTLTQRHGKHFKFSSTSRS